MRNGNSNCQANRAATNASGAARFFTPGRGWRVSANRLVKLIRAVGKLLLRGGFGTNADPAGMGRVVVRTVTGRLKTGHLWALQNGHSKVVDSYQIA
jgi:hypothetical protein